MFESQQRSPSLPVPGRVSRTREREDRRADIEREMSTLQGEVNAANARLVELVEEHARHEDWRVHEGIRSESAFLSWQIGLPPADASGVSAVAEGLRDLPRIRAAFRAGRLSLGQVRALVRVATAEDEPELLRLALGMSASQLTSFCAAYRRVLRIEQGRHRARFLRTSYTADGMWHISGRMAAEEGAVVDRAIEAARATLRAGDAPEAPAGDDPSDDAEEPFGAEAADALVRLAQSFITNGTPAPSDPDRHVVVIHADAASLATAEGEATIEGGGTIPAQAAARIACQAPVIALLERDGRPLAVGRKTRRVGRALRRALEARDARCRFPGCHRRGRLEAHHIEHWQHGGETGPENLLLLCRPHHIAVHEHGLAIERSFDGFLFRRPDGTSIRLPGVHARGPGIRHGNRARGIEVSDQTVVPEWGGERGSIGYVVDLFVARRPPGGPAP